MVHADDRPLLAEGEREGSNSSDGSGSRWWLFVVVITCVVACAAFGVGYVVGIVNSRAAVTPPAPSPGPSSCLPGNFADVSLVAPDILLDMRYATDHNFMGRRVVGYWSAKCWLTSAAATALAAVSADARARGFAVKVYDCYRPQIAVDDFVSWSTNPWDTLTRAEFYPTLNKTDLFPEYIARRSGHSRGSTVDLSIVALPLPPAPPPYQPGQLLQPCFAPRSQRYPDMSIDMGCGFDCFSEVAHTNTTLIDPAAHANRMLLLQLMTRHGFINYDQEWWHFTLANEPYPTTFFAFPIQDSCSF
jgi:D-alanyl-D-alanine dipeptidase